MPKTILFSIAFFLEIFLLAPLNTMAQFTQPLSQTNPSTLSLSPRYPEPHEEVTITLNDYSVDTRGATIQWFINGEEKTDSRNTRSLTLTTGPLGEHINVTTITTLPNGSTLTATETIIPIRVDLLIEADTRVPTFYAGRAVPAVGGQVRVTAIPFTGQPKPANTFSYVWHIGDAIQEGGSQYGKNSTTFVAGFEKEVLVSVDVLDEDGGILTSESIYIPLVEPELFFYEVNPLRGISEHSMKNPFTLIGEEIRVRAEPYFLDSDLFAKNPLQEWKLNGKTVSNPSNDPQEITVRRSGSTGRFSLAFHVRNLQQLLQGVKDSITITF